MIRRQNVRPGDGNRSQTSPEDDAFDAMPSRLDPPPGSSATPEEIGARALHTIDKGMEIVSTPLRLLSYPACRMLDRIYSPLIALRQAILQSTFGKIGYHGPGEAR